MPRARLVVVLTLVMLASGCVVKQEPSKVEGGRSSSEPSQDSPTGTGASTAPVAEPVPVLSFETDQDLAYVMVVHASQGLDWGDFEINASAPLHVVLNSQAIPEDPRVDQQPTRMPAGPLVERDFFDVCAEDQDGTPAFVQLRHVPSGGVVYAQWLDDVPPCGTITQ